MWPDFSKARILVAGDVMLDSYWHGSTSRISPEAPVPVVRVDKQEHRIGGAGNVAINAATLGAQVQLHGLVGQDDAADTLTQLLQNLGVRACLHRVHGGTTINKLRVISRHQQVIRLDFEESFAGIDDSLLAQPFRQALSEVDLVVLSDYLKGTLQGVEQLVAAARDAGVPVLVDPKGTDFNRYRGATLLTPNVAELEAVVGRWNTEEELERKATALRDTLALDAILLTRSEKGMTLFARGHEPVSLPTRAQEVFDVTGAGDTVIATLAVAMSVGLPVVEAMNMANYAAGVVVSKLGTSTVSMHELQNAMHEGGGPIERGVCTEDELLLRMQRARAQGERIVMTNGCFDILHPGHVDYLEQARQLGDRLVVAVNSDDSVRRLKGSNRPVNDLATRMRMLSALACVDWVVPFAEDTPERLYARALPDVLVKGGDYTEDQVAGAAAVKAAGGEVRILSFTQGHSTTRVIERIKQQT
jgi:D-beta-D-heptose 7-phosphate kinase/D-beta-D-heptose 1-phosphate adenosyltransferase